MVPTSYCLSCDRKVEVGVDVRRCPACDAELVRTFDPDGDPGAAHTRTVLVVDDDEDVRHALRLLFEVEEFDVVGEAANGTDAVWLAASGRPAFIVLDYAMPGMTGEQTAVLLRKVLPSARIVAFSAVLDSKPAWADAYLNKDRIGEIAPLLARLVTTPSAPAAEAVT